jgi:hypothetical protein
MHVSLKFNLDTQLSININGGPRTSHGVAWFNTVRVGVWLVVLAVAVVVALNATDMDRGRDEVLAIGFTPALISAVLYVIIVVRMVSLLIHPVIGFVLMSSNIRHHRRAGSSAHWWASWLPLGRP